jgi:hypothetical protein
LRYRSAIWCNTAQCSCCLSLIFQKHNFCMGFLSRLIPDLGSSSRKLVLSKFKLHYECVFYYSISIFVLPNPASELINVAVRYMALYSC